MDYKPTYVIGDVHGCFFTLKALVEKLPKHSKIIFVGDLCDKGNFSKEVIEYIIENNFEAVIGNHDVMLLRYIKNAFKGETNWWTTSSKFGGLKTVNSYYNHKDFLEKHIDFLNDLPIIIEIDNYIISHGFALPYYKNRYLEENRHKIISNRINRKYSDWEKDYTSYKVINIFGHCDFEEVLVGENYFGIDTGCVYGGKLTALELKTHNIIQENVHPIDIFS